MKRDQVDWQGVADMHLQSLHVLMRHNATMRSLLIEAADLLPILDGDGNGRDRRDTLARSITDVLGTEQPMDPVELRGRD